MCHYYQDNRFYCGNKTWATHRNPYPLWWRACFSFAVLCGWTHIDFQAFPCFRDGLWACFLSLCLSTPTPHLHSVMGDGFAILNSELHFGYTETLQRKKKKKVGHQRANADWKSVMSFARAPASALLPLYLKGWRSDVTLQRNYFLCWVLRKYIFLAKLWRPRSNTKTPRPILRNQEMDKSSSIFPRHHVTSESFAPLGHSVTVLTPSPMIHIKSLSMRFNVIDP